MLKLVKGKRGVDQRERTKASKGPQCPHCDRYLNFINAETNAEGIPEVGDRGICTACLGVFEISALGNPVISRHPHLTHRELFTLVLLKTLE